MNQEYLAPYVGGPADGGKALIDARLERLFVPLRDGKVYAGPEWTGYFAEYLVHHDDAGVTTLQWQGNVKRPQPD